MTQSISVNRRGRLVQALAGATIAATLLAACQGGASTQGSAATAEADEAGGADEADAAAEPEEPAGAVGAALADPASTEDSISSIGVLTATVVPGWTRMRASTPLAGAGTSTTPLSISAVSRGSSLRTASPSCFSHSATVPSSIVRPSIGMVTWCGIVVPLLDGVAVDGVLPPSRSE